jgi:hypothetical protein
VEKESRPEAEDRGFKYGQASAWRLPRGAVAIAFVIRAPVMVTSLEGAGSFDSLCSVVTAVSG